MCEKANFLSSQIITNPKRSMELDEYNGRTPYLSFFGTNASTMIFAHRWLREANHFLYARITPWMAPYLI